MKAPCSNKETAPSLDDVREIGSHDMEPSSRLRHLIARYKASGVEQQVDYEKFYLYSLVTHSTAVEGSTITEVENQLLFDEGISPQGKALTEQLMNVDLKDAYLHWLPRVKEIKRFDVTTLCEMAASVMRRTGSEYNTALGSFDSAKGDLRLVNVRAGASGRSYMSFQKVETKTKELCEWLNQSLATVDPLDAAAIYRLSFIAHYRLVTIHPWVDGNGRTTRLLMNALQYRFGLPMSKIPPTDKARYIQALVDGRQEDDEELFVSQAVEMLMADLEKQLTIFAADTDVTDNVTENAGNVTDNVTENAGNVTDTQRRILEILRQAPFTPQSRLAEIIGIHRVNINRNIRRLVDQGILTRVGSDRKGYWKITPIPRS